jgi:hypothetical protein
MRNANFTEAAVRNHEELFPNHQSTSQARLREALDASSSSSRSRGSRYLYLSQTLEEIEDAASRQVFLDAVAHGSVISWQHINSLGEYDFSDEKLRDQVGTRPPKILQALRLVRLSRY